MNPYTAVLGRWPRFPTSPISYLENSELSVV